MERSFRQYLLAGTMLAGGAAFGGATPAAAAVCPAVGADSGCALILDITSVSGGVGTYTVSKGPSYGTPYDSIEDTLLGVTNSSGSPVNSIHLSAKTDIFGFDGDGVGGPTYLNLKGETSSTANYAGTISKTGSFNLSGPLDTFSGITAADRSGDLNFPGGLVAGGSAFFSLEEALTLSSIVTATPEPATLSILGAALAGFGLLRRRKKVT